MMDVYKIGKFILDNVFIECIIPLSFLDDADIAALESGDFRGDPREREEEETSKAG